MSVHAAPVTTAPVTTATADRRRALLALPAAALLAAAGCSNGTEDAQAPETVTATVSAPVEVSSPATEQPAGDREVLVDLRIRGARDDVEVALAEQRAVVVRGRV